VNSLIKSQLLMAIAASTIMSSGMAAAADAIDVRNVADPARHPYQQTASLNCATSAGGCAVVFPAITTARTVVLHASCAMELVDSNLIAYVSLSDSTLQIPSYLPITRYDDVVGGESFYTISGDPYAFFETGQQPTIDVATRGPSNGTSITCTLAGYYL
jgi:hypothetical protein